MKLNEPDIVDLIAGEAHVEPIDVLRLVAALEVGCRMHRRFVLGRLSGVLGTGRPRNAGVIPTTNLEIRAAAMALRGLAA